MRRYHSTMISLLKKRWKSTFISPYSYFWQLQSEQPILAVDVLFSTQLPLANVLDGNRNSMNVYKHAGRSHGEEVNIVPYVYTYICKTTIFSKFQIFIYLLFFNSWQLFTFFNLNYFIHLVVNTNLLL